MRPALIVVDMQEDFCPPNGSLAVQGARALAPTINKLLANPSFVVRVATRDYHPSDHISFASNHPPPNNRPFESYVELMNPAPNKQNETKSQRLWPAHCVHGTPGVEMIPEIDSSKIDLYVKKGMNSQVEMYSAFCDVFGNPDSTGGEESVDLDLRSFLTDKKVTDVFVVGVAGDYCVKQTVIDAVRAGFKGYFVEDATRCTDPGEACWAETKKELIAAGVSIVRSDGPEIATLVGS
ncbi:NAD(+) salvage pathway protein [Aspergillus nanangensis]|uniref:nicotinamidase n=1 Tax=Aspergillus nanangensis TaxID=2582783 RepID=A0AAD4CEM3_ASPNN|nr:NAD(+) salvage pathway protein [Aspergillus nanangensis]